MDSAIPISMLNDFIFCPASIYFHNLYGGMEQVLYQSSYQLNGTKAHETVDKKTYSAQSSVVASMDVYSQKYNLIGKIDLYYLDKKLLVERKKHISQIYDGQIFQLYGQYYAMKEMGYAINELRIYSMDDNKAYGIELPENNDDMREKFERTIVEMRVFDLQSFLQTNAKKCEKCIYEPACDRALSRGD